LTRRRVTLKDRLHRLSWRAAILIGFYTLPTLLSLVHPMEQETADAMRTVAAGGLVWAAFDWASTQGRRRPGEGGEK
jgi:hypothetical protein